MGGLFIFVKSLSFNFKLLTVLGKSNQGNQGYSNQKNVIQGQRPDMENKHTQQRT